ncbi:WD-40 repeat protein, partial [Reticulomyxa filosa]
NKKGGKTQGSRSKVFISYLKLISFDVHIAFCYTRLSLVEEAKQAADKALNIYPNDNELRQLRNRIDIIQYKNQRINEKLWLTEYKFLTGLVKPYYSSPHQSTGSIGKTHDEDIKIESKTNEDKQAESANGEGCEGSYAKDKIQLILNHWIRILHIKFGWINEFDKLIINYVSYVFMFDTFRSSSKVINTFNGHTDCVYSIDYVTFGNCQLICSGSYDTAVCIWDVDNNKHIQSFNIHSRPIYCVRFSSYHYQNYNKNVICSSSHDRSIRFWDFKQNQQLQIFNDHTDSVNVIEFSPFNGGRYLCSGSCDETIRLWDVETSKLLHIFNEHENSIWCVDISPLQSNSNNINDKNNIGVIGGNGYTICSGSFDQTIRIWDIETTKQLNVFNGHTDYVRSVKYGSNELSNLILSGSNDRSVRLWDIRSGQETQVFNRHTHYVWSVEYSPFAINDSSDGNSNVICSGSFDNTIRFWDIRSNKNELYIINGFEEDYVMSCLKFISLKKNSKYYWNLCYGSASGSIYIYG